MFEVELYQLSVFCFIRKSGQGVKDNRNHKYTFVIDEDELKYYNTSKKRMEQTSRRRETTRRKQSIQSQQEQEGEEKKKIKLLQKMSTSTDTPAESLWGYTV